MLVHLFSAAVNGLVATVVEIELNSFPGDKITISGLPDAAVRESYSRVMSAIINSGYKKPAMSMIINMAPANLRKEGTGYDLPFAIAILACAKMIQTTLFKKTLLVGELGLDGTLRPVRGCLPVAIEARKQGFETLIVPAENVREAAVVDRLQVYGAHHLAEVVDFLNGKPCLQPTEVDTRAEFYANQEKYDADFSEVRGQENVKRAFEVAAAGGHNLLLVGSPGCGKSMMAKRLPSILPPLTLAESLETTQIHSVAGILPSGVSLIAKRPFRSPHHTISDVALIGGGTTFQPGEISLAHNGVLFLDELPEFKRTVLEVLRQPMEERRVTISRAKMTIEYPASFMLIAAMNPCPCGYYNHPTVECTCPAGAVKRYLNKVSGPLMDRIDIHIEVTPVPVSRLNQEGRAESSAAIRERVIAARAIQTERFKGNPGVHCNAQMGSKLTREHCQLTDECHNIMEMAMNRLGLSARAYDRILRVSRTIADLEAAPDINPDHLREAITYRSLDRDSWGQ